jgi:hypothetical protein
MGRRWRTEQVLRFCADAGVDDPLDAVRQRAQTISRDLTGPPYKLDGNTVLASLGIQRIAYARDLAGDGRIIRADGGYLIEINSTRAPSRMAFTLAHEIGHTSFLPFDVRSRVTREDRSTEAYRRDDEEEFLCDVAAAELLMPKRPFLDQVCAVGPSVKGILSLGRSFETSLLSTARRFAEMGAWKCYIAFWRVDGDGLVRLEYGFRSGRLNIAVPKGSIASSRSIVVAALSMGRARGVSDIGLISRWGDVVGPVFVDAMKLQGQPTILSVAVLDQHPEQLCAIADRSEVPRGGRAPTQGAFHFPPQRR